MIRRKPKIIDINFSYVSSNIRISKDKILFFLVCCYFFIAPFGNVFRFGSQEGSLGIGTVIVLIVVLLTFIKSLSKFFIKKIWFTFFLLLFWLSISSLFGDVKSAYISLLQLSIYILFAIGITHINFTPHRLKKLFLFTISALLISSTLTIIDFLGVVEIPFFNEFTAGVSIIGERFKIVGASGPFPRRSAMAAYYGLLLPLIMVYGFLEKEKAKKVFSFITFIVGMIAITITFNRAAPFAVILVALFFIIAGGGMKLKLKIIFGIIFLSLLGFVAIQTYFPNQMKAIRYKMNLTLQIGTYREEDLIRQRESDRNRIYLLKESLGKIAENPIGYGLTKVEMSDRSSVMNAHNNITQIIWGTGVFGFFWLILFGVQIFNIFKSKLKGPYYIYYECIKYGLLGWFLVSITHTNWGIGIMWALFGILVMLKSANLKLVRVHTQ